MIGLVLRSLAGLLLTIGIVLCVAAAAAFGAYGWLRSATFAGLRNATMATLEVPIRIEDGCWSGTAVAISFDLDDQPDWNGLTERGLLVASGSVDELIRTAADELRLAAPLRNTMGHAKSCFETLGVDLFDYAAGPSRIIVMAGGSQLVVLPLDAALPNMVISQ